MPENDTTIISFPYIMNTGLQQQITPFKWNNNSNNFPLLNFNNSEQNTYLQKEYSKYIQDNKTIGEYLNRNYICEPDALRVAKPLPEYNIPKVSDKYKEIKIPDIPTEYNVKFDITKNMFNGSVEDLNRCLKGTKLEGKGQMFLDAQIKHGINAIFLMSIVKEESHFGAAPAKEGKTVHKYNIAGLKTGKRIHGHIYQDNESYEACIESLCKNLHKHYIRRNKTSIDAIQKIYAPGNTQWAAKVKNTMGEISEQIMEPYLGSNN